MSNKQRIFSYLLPVVRSFLTCEIHAKTAHIVSRTDILLLFPLPPIKVTVNTLLLKRSYSDMING